MVGASKLNEEMVAEIKDLFKTTTLKDKEISEMYNVSRIHINHIRHGYRWNTTTRSFVSKKEIDQIISKDISLSASVSNTTKRNLFDLLCEMIDVIISNIKGYVSK